MQVLDQDASQSDFGKLLTTSIEDVMESYQGVDARTERYPVPIVFNPVHRGPPRFLDPATLENLMEQALDDELDELDEQDEQQDEEQEQQEQQDEQDEQQDEQQDEEQDEQQDEQDEQQDELDEQQDEEQEQQEQQEQQDEQQEQQDEQQEQQDEQDDEQVEFEELPSWTTLTDYYKDIPTFLLDDDLMGLVCQDDYERYRYTLFTDDGVFLCNHLPQDVSLVNLDQRTQSTKIPEGFYMTNSLHIFPPLISLRGDHDGSDEVYLE